MRVRVHVVEQRKEGRPYHNSKFACGARLYQAGSAAGKSGGKGQAGVYDIAWIETCGVSYLVAGCTDGVVGMWQVLVDEGYCDVSLKWKTTNGELDMKDATIQDVQGLSQLNRKLLKQRGAVGEPVHHLREARKKLATMASVVSNLKSTSERAVENPSFTRSALAKELEQKFEHKFQQAKDSLFQDLMAVVENIHGCE